MYGNSGLPQRSMPRYQGGGIIDKYKRADTMPQYQRAETQPQFQGGGIIPKYESPGKVQTGPTQGPQTGGPLPTFNQFQGLQGGNGIQDMLTQALSSRLPPRFQGMSPMGQGPQTGGPGPLPQSVVRQSVMASRPMAQDMPQTKIAQLKAAMNAGGPAALRAMAPQQIGAKQGALLQALFGGDFRGF